MKHLHRALSVLVTTLFAGLVTASGHAAAPYPPSTAITGVTFDWLTHDERAGGSDNWPITWSDDGHQYTVWGDGGGFGGSNSDGRVSLGVARVEGPRTSYQGFNVWGGKDPENPAQFGGKTYGVLSLSGDLYMWWGPGSGATSFSETRLAHSTDRGATWTQSSWDLTEVDDQLVMPTILNFGKDYAGARDTFVYHYFIRKEPTGSGLTIQKGGSPATGKIDLGRVPQSQLLDQSAYEFFAGLDGNGDPVWTNDADQRQPVFEDPNGVGWNVSVSYNEPLTRYLLVTEHTESKKGLMGLFDAPEPWGPWTTVEYYESPDYFGSNVGHSESTFFWNFSNKWLSVDGIDFTLIFTGIGGDDSWNSIRGSFSTPGGGGPTRTLTVLKTGSGTGGVASLPAGIDCGAVCQAAYPVGTEVSLAATPAADSVFLAWGGDSDCTDGTVDLDQNRECIAIFDLAPSGSGDLVGYWALDEGAGVQAGDGSGQAHQGALINMEPAVDWISGALGPALTFDGNDEFVEVGDSAALDLTGGDWTIAAWIKPATFGHNSQGRIVDHGGGSSGGAGWTFQLMDNASVAKGLAVQINNAFIGRSDPNVISLDEWQHVAATASSGTLTFYVDGVPRGTRNGLPAPNARSSPVRIGMRATDLDRDFQGAIDEVRVYGRALAATEIFDLAAPCSQAQDLTLSDQTVTTIETFEACNTISAGQDFLVTAEAIFRARKRIVLENGFTVAVGASFTAELDPTAGSN